jgi:hypothetical protein
MEYFRYIADEKTNGFVHKFTIHDELDNNKIVYTLDNIPRNKYFEALVVVQRVLNDFNINYDTYTRTVLNYCYSLNMP